MTKLIAFTGHRTPRLQSGAPTKLFDLFKLISQYSDITVISGMAQGFDTLVAKTAVHFNVPFIAAVPFKSFDVDSIISEAEEINYISDDYSFSVFQKRNIWMVDKCKLLVTAWDGNKNGGTWNTISYALKNNKDMIHLYKSP